MIPDNVNVDALVSTLRSSDVAVQASKGSEAKGGDATLQPTTAYSSSLEDALASLPGGRGAEPFGVTKLIVLNNKDISGPDSRDVAQAVKDATGADTVLLQASGNSAVVSDGFSRFQIESKQGIIAGTLDPGAPGVLVTELDHLHTPGTAIGALGVVAALGAAAVAAAWAAWWDRSERSHQA